MNCVSEVTSNGPRSVRNARLPVGVGRKNLIFTAPGQGLADQVNAAEFSVAAWLAGFERSIAVTGVWLNPKLGLDGRFPRITVWPSPTHERRAKDRMAIAVEWRMAKLPVATPGPFRAVPLRRSNFDAHWTSDGLVGRGL